MARSCVCLKLRAACCAGLLRHERRPGLHQGHKDPSRGADSWLGRVYSASLLADGRCLTRAAGLRSIRLPLGSAVFMNPARVVLAV